MKAEMLEVQAELDKYRKDHSSESDKIRALLPFDGVNELSENMFRLTAQCELISKQIKVMFYMC